MEKIFGKMDYRLNNEALIACCISPLIERRSLTVAQVTLILTILLNDSVRHFILTTPRIGIDNKKYNKISLSYHELMPYIMNSLVLLIQSGCLALEEDFIKKLPPNSQLSGVIEASSDGRLKRILNDMDAAMDYICSHEISTLYKELNISL